MTEIKGCDGKLYVSAIFDCFDSSVIGLAMDTNMKASLCKETLENAAKAYPSIRGALSIQTMPKKKLCRKIILPHVFLLFVSNYSA